MNRDEKHARLIEMWPLVWRSTMERRISERDKLIVEPTLREARKQARDEVAQDLREARNDRTAANIRFEAANKREALALELAQQMEAARIRAEVRAQEWEAIARELIARGAGRPHPDAKERAENPIAKRIREESNGDPSLAAHFWRYVGELRAGGKKDEEIVGMIGWDVVNGTEQESTQ